MRKVNIKILTLIGVCLYVYWQTSLAGSSPPIIKQVDGIIHVINSSTAMGNEHTLQIQEIWSYSLSDDNGEDIPLIGMISSVSRSGRSNLFLLDKQVGQVLEYSVNDGFVRVLSTRGEGPGEILQAIDITTFNDGRVAVAKQMPGEVIILDGRGGHSSLRVSRNSESSGGLTTLERVSRIPFGYVVKGTAITFSNGRQDACAFISIMDDQCIEKANLMQQCTSLERLTSGEGLPDISAVSGALMACGLSIYLVKDPNKYEICVYGNEGNIERMIEREFIRRRYTQTEQDQLRLMYEDMQKKVPIASKLFDSGPPQFAPSVISLEAMSNGELWVVSGASAEPVADNTVRVYDVFDIQGRYARNVRIVSKDVKPTDMIYMYDDCMLSIRGLSGQDQIYNNETSDYGEGAKISCYRIN